MVVLYINIDDMYFTEVLTFEPAKLGRPPGPQDLNRVFEFRRLVTASLILTWVAMMAVKFSFLALFKRLIDRIYPLTVYWWAVVAFNLAVTGYGASVYVIACPHFSGSKVVSCLGGETRHKTMQYAISQLVLDVFGDLLILYIPVQLIWQVKLKLIQKFTLACSLCLTVVVIIFTVTRASGLEWQGKLDVLWEVYFQIVAAEIGLILVSTTAFRAIFVSRAQRKQQSPQKSPPFLTKSVRILKRTLNPRRWTSKSSKDISNGQKDGNAKQCFEEKLPNIPGATMTGMRTFDDDQGMTTKGDAELSVIGSYEEASNDAWPLAKDGRQSTCSHCGQHVQSKAV
ncbi:MAG: hypothetical protein LQ343_001987 [Gyalolechia ehrenbergii]|nr:MAG: hypothetical protein LQ343_001987 [Gyalolechia ehrenbergii]